MFVFVLGCHCDLLFYHVFFAVWGFVFPFLFSSCNRGGLWNIKVILPYTVCLYCSVGYYRVLIGMGKKISLYIRTRKQGSRIDSIPLKKLIKLSKFRKKRWEFKDGWLILEAF